MNIPFQIADWNDIPVIIKPGETGDAHWRVLQFGDLRIRIVEYSANYKADHCCEKGHIMYCIDGEMETELSNGEKHILKKGMSYLVSDDMSSHRSVSKNGVILFIVDGGFLNAAGL
ncbi:DHCW motif cupin fold protein [soil metagenome]